MMPEVIVGQQLQILRGKEKQGDLVARMHATGVEALAISQQRYSDWEGGTRPPYEALVALADFFGVELRWLLTGEEPRTKVPLEAPAIVLGEVQRLVADPKAAMEEIKRRLAERAERVALADRTIEQGQEALSAPPIAESEEGKRRENR